MKLYFWVNLLMSNSNWNEKSFQALIAVLMTWHPGGKKVVIWSPLYNEQRCKVQFIRLAIKASLNLPFYIFYYKRFCILEYTINPNTSIHGNIDECSWYVYITIL